MIPGIIIGVIVAVIVIASLVIVYRNSPAQKEKRARKKVENVFKDMDGVVYRDYDIDVDGEKARIDLIYIGKSGMYVAKVNTQTGRIYGDNMSKEWLIVSRGKETKFDSPIKDKDKMVNLLRTIMPTDYQIYSCVVFLNADIKEVRCTNVLTLEGLKSYIQDRPKVLSPNQIDDIKALLKKYKKEIK